MACRVAAIGPVGELQAELRLDAGGVGGAFELREIVLVRRGVDAAAFRLDLVAFRSHAFGFAFRLGNGLRLDHELADEQDERIDDRQQQAEPEMLFAVQPGRVGELEGGEPGQQPDQDQDKPDEAPAPLFVRDVDETAGAGEKLRKQFFDEFKNSAHVLFPWGYYSET